MLEPTPPGDPTPSSVPYPLGVSQLSQYAYPTRGDLGPPPLCLAPLGVSLPPLAVCLPH